jgi:hypothetical protein
MASLPIGLRTLSLRVVQLHQEHLHEIGRDVEQQPYYIKPLPAPLSTSTEEKGKSFELMEILDLRKEDLALMRGFRAGVEPTIDAYIRNATEWDGLCRSRKYEHTVTQQCG